MTKRLFLGFTLLACGITGVGASACSSDDDDNDPVVATGGAGNMGGAGNLGGGTDTGGSTDSGGSTGSGTYSVDAGGFVTSGEWKGYAWTAVESNTLSEGVASTIEPGNFSAVEAGGQLCASGIVAQDAAYGGVAMLGININQEAASSETEPPVGLWQPSGTGIAYDITNNGSSQIRIQIQGELGYPDEAWCADVSATPAGTVGWTDFNTECWAGGAGTAYDGSIALESVMVLIPGSNTAETPYSFCINSIGPA